GVEQHFDAGDKNGERLDADECRHREGTGRDGFVAGPERAVGGEFGGRNGVDYQRGEKEGRGEDWCEDEALEPAEVHPGRTAGADFGFGERGTGGRGGGHAERGKAVAAREERGRDSGAAGWVAGVRGGERRRQGGGGGFEDTGSDRDVRGGEGS